ncbi:MmcQ/YjbR family DNA-binding protein [Nonomuraea glycinis]|uniref:MmcQ/YjbR family DNA-binding protein n=1 Tax=Nonomuraea glycinis TaxID=2047744 RepID=A0A918E3N7_9ACTN|nr:MmcQ/YjbR family DNA-binding protein [Nonomuraea glycinis]MCA2182010.1 MmcQ/YjbR family DNA-binding protein [Nonomuraea glycinis]GGP02489.1 hypothetical protein GCM10012278_09930 [Nonomuraea glycinis]
MNPLDALRELCRALPETTERLSHGEPTWFVRGKKTFVMYADHHHDGRLGFCVERLPAGPFGPDPAEYEGGPVNPAR